MNSKYEETWKSWRTIMWTAIKWYLESSNKRERKFFLETTGLSVHFRMIVHIFYFSRQPGVNSFVLVNNEMHWTKHIRLWRVVESSVMILQANPRTLKHSWEWWSMMRTTWGSRTHGWVLLTIETSHHLSCHIATPDRSLK
jgi:hypothetical protein